MEIIKKDCIFVKFKDIAAGEIFSFRFGSKILYMKTDEGSYIDLLTGELDRPGCTMMDSCVILYSATLTAEPKF